ncbi:MAG: VapC toxin family PIN domain ribonuclease [Anaerolineae bacterium]|jgi:predicted nucleic acid-binding protein|nr:MAG: VapC toxin family PIN domain ribonuclease [Anaerolineae bacterium]
MSHVFVDTAGWGNLVDATQPYHTLAVSIYQTTRQQRNKLVTTNYVLLELVSLMSSPLKIPRPKMIAFIDALKQSPFVEIIHIDPLLDERAWQLLKSRQDKGWSLTDCASFVVMDKRSIQEALTTDHHFEQAGFIRLLK